MVMLQVGQVINERYELCEILGTGGMSVVFRAHDRKVNSELAIKIFTIYPERDNLKRFAREFRLIAALNHPHCIKAIEFGESDCGPFYTMELFIAHPITSLLGMPLPVILDALYQAASALEYVHVQRIVHRDIKPSNLLVRLPGGPANRQSSGVEVKLTDFGLARFQNTLSSISVNNAFTGTIRYCAPEQFGHGSIDHRTDLYSFGLVCYEMLTGTFPFEKAAREGWKSIMHAKVTNDIPALSMRESGLPETIVDSVMALLAREIIDRPASITSLRQALGTWLGKTQSNDPLCSVQGALSDEKTFIGRVQELATCRRFMHRALSPQARSSAEWQADPVPSILFLIGEPGIGKSELTREIRRLACGEGALVYEGRCFQGNMSLYQPFVEILRNIMIEWRTAERAEAPHKSDLTESVTQILNVAVPASQTYYGTAKGSTTTSKGFGGEIFNTLLRDCTPEILSIAPDLRRWLPGESFRQIDLGREMHYVFRAVATFFTEFASMRGICLIFEDIQWADKGTLDLLQQLCAGLFRAREVSGTSNSSWPRLFICGTLRQGHSSAVRLAARLTVDKMASRLELRPFSKDEIRDLTAALLGTQPAAVADTMSRALCDYCRGNPFFVEQMISSWKSQHRIVRKNGEWQLLVSISDTSNWPDSIRDVIRSRIQLLSAAAQQMLGVASVIGSVIDIDVLREACRDFTEDIFLGATDELLTEKKFLEVGTKPDLEFGHELTRDLVYHELSASRRHLLHKRVGEIMERNQSQGICRSPEILAHHFYAAGIHDKAFQYLTEAGENALRAYAVGDAIHHLRAAKEMIAGATDVQQRQHVNELLATAYTAAGKPLRAMDCYNENLKSTNVPCSRARMLHNTGSLYFRIGDFDAAVAHFDRALSELKLQRSQSRMGNAYQIALSYLFYLLPYPFYIRHRLTVESTNKILAARDIYYVFSYLWAQCDFLQCASATFRQWTLARRIGEPMPLADANGLLALLFGFAGFHRAARRTAHQALSHAVQCNDPFVIATAKSHVGIVNYFAGNLTEAERLLKEALGTLDRRGDSWIRMLSYHNLRHLYAIQGRAEQEMACARVEQDIAERVDDPEGKCWGAYGLADAFARAGRLAEAYEQMQRALELMSNRINMIAEPTMLHTQGFLHLQAGDYEAARLSLEKARDIVERNFAYVDYSIRLYPLLVEAVLGAQWHVRSPHANVDAAWRISGRALFWAKRFPNYLPHAWRVRGRAAYARGSIKQAASCFKKAIESAGVIGAKYDLARTHFDMAKVFEHDRGHHERSGRTIFEELQIPWIDTA